MGQKVNLPNNHGGVRTALNLMIPNESLATFNPVNISLSDKETSYDIYLQTGTLTFTNPTNTYGVGAVFSGYITTTGNTISFGSQYDVITNNYSNDVDTYYYAFYWNGFRFVGIIKRSTFVFTPAPIIQSAVVEDADQDALIVVFNENVTITDLTGLSLNFTNGTPKTLLSVGGTGTNTLTFALSADILSTDVFNFVVDGTNNIINSNSITLEPVTESVTNNVGIIQLNAPILGAAVVDSETQITVPVTDSNTSPNEENTEMQYKEQSSGTWLVHGTMIQDGISYSYDSLTTATAYDFRAIAKGDGILTIDSIPSNTIQKTTDSNQAFTFQDLTNMTSYNDGLIKNAGGGAWNAGARSVQVLSGVGSYECTVETQMLVGFSNNTPDGNYTNIDNGVNLDIISSNQNLFENGSVVGSVSNTISTASVFKFERNISDDVLFYIDDVLQHTFSTSLSGNIWLHISAFSQDTSAILNLTKTGAWS